MVLLRNYNTSYIVEVFDASSAVILFRAALNSLPSIVLPGRVEGRGKRRVEHASGLRPFSERSSRDGPHTTTRMTGLIQTLNGKRCVAWTAVVAVREGCRIAINPYLHGRVSLHVCHYARRVSAPRQGVVVGMVGQM